MEKISGNIMDLVQKPTSTGKQCYRVLVDGNWFSNFGVCPDEVKFAFEKGKPVEIDFSFDNTGKWRNIKGIKPLDSLEQSNLTAEIKVDTSLEGSYREKRVEILKACLEDALSAAEGSSLVVGDLTEGDKKLVQKMAITLYIGECKTKRY